MSRVLGELLEEVVVRKIADDLYTGGNSIPELLHNWERILKAFETNNLRLSARKTTICPVTTTILGWVWSAGTITASPHKITPLATADPPKTTKALRSWIGAFKHLKACVPNYSALLSPLEQAVGGQDSKQSVIWTPTLHSSFKTAQKSLLSIKTIAIPQPDDQLVITNDGAVKNGGIGSVLYVVRNKETVPAGYFSAKLKPHQAKWLPCEVEALAISSAVNHWAPYIINNTKSVQILTDSKPCVQAYHKLAAGQFSSSARITSFLSTLSRYHVSLQYIPGTSNLPADYHSRHPMECSTQNCQVCTFVAEQASAAVLKISVGDVLSGKSLLPFTSPVAWKEAQHDCSALRRVYAHLVQGTRPSKKDTHVKDVKRYLNVCTVGRDGLLVHRRAVPFSSIKDLIVVPQHIISGLLSALHLRLEHPTKSQLLQVFNRFFFALDADNEIKHVTSSCPQCAALATLPHDMETFSTSPPSTGIGTRLLQTFFADADSVYLFCGKLCLHLPSLRSYQMRSRQLFDQCYLKQQLI